MLVRKWVDNSSGKVPAIRPRGKLSFGHTASSEANFHGDAIRRGRKPESRAEAVNSTEFEIGNGNANRPAPPAADLQYDLSSSGNFMITTG
jgi:hypothetical protein